MMWDFLFKILREEADRQEAAKIEMVKLLKVRLIVPVIFLFSTITILSFIYVISIVLKESCVSGDLASVRQLLSSLPDAVAVASTINHIGSGGSNTLLFKVGKLYADGQDCFLKKFIFNGSRRVNTATAIWCRSCWRAAQTAASTR